MIRDVKGENWRLFPGDIFSGQRIRKGQQDTLVPMFTAKEKPLQQLEQESFFPKIKLSLDHLTPWNKAITRTLHELVAMLQP